MEWDVGATLFFAVAKIADLSSSPPTASVKPDAMAPLLLTLNSELCYEQPTDPIPTPIPSSGGTPTFATNSPHGTTSNTTSSYSSTPTPLFTLKVIIVFLLSYETFSSLTPFLPSTLISPPPPTMTPSLPMPAALGVSTTSLYHTIYNQLSGKQVTSLMTYLCREITAAYS
jgi:hypothetical protein